MVEQELNRADGQAVVFQTHRRTGCYSRKKERAQQLNYVFFWTVCIHRVSSKDAASFKLKHLKTRL
jgi:hypothetical protein